MTVGHLTGTACAHRTQNPNPALIAVDECLFDYREMYAEVEPVRRKDGGYQVHREATGQAWFWCRTHDVAQYGPIAEVTEAARAHAPGLIKGRGVRCACEKAS